MLELIPRTVDGTEYQFSQFGAKRSLKLLLKLSKIVGKPLAMAVASADGSGSLLDKQLNPNMLAQAVEALMERIEESEALEIIETLTSGDGCLCKHQKIVFDLHYEGRLPHMFKVLFAALEVQYGNFFDALQDLPVLARKPTTQAQPA